MTDLPQRFHGDFDQTVRHLTSIFEDFTEARDVWRSGATPIQIGRRSGRRRPGLLTQRYGSCGRQRSWASRPGRRRSFW